jgi:hypothetical protein
MVRGQLFGQTTFHISALTSYTVQFGTHYLVSLGLSFLSCKLGIILAGQLRKLNEI